MTVPAPLFRRPDGRGVWLMPLIGGRVRLVVGQIGSPEYDDGW